MKLAEIYWKPCSFLFHINEKWPTGEAKWKPVKTWSCKKYKRKIFDVSERKEKKKKCNMNDSEKILSKKHHFAISQISTARSGICADGALKTSSKLSRQTSDPESWLPLSLGAQQDWTLGWVYYKGTRNGGDGRDTEGAMIALWLPSLPTMAT